MLAMPDLIREWKKVCRLGVSLSGVPARAMANFAAGWETGLDTVPQIKGRSWAEAGMCLECTNTKCTTFNHRFLVQLVVVDWPSSCVSLITAQAKGLAESEQFPTVFGTRHLMSVPRPSQPPTLTISGSFFNFWGDRIPSKQWNTLPFP